LLFTQCCFGEGYFFLPFAVFFFAAFFTVFFLLHPHVEHITASFQKFVRVTYIIYRTIISRNMIKAIDFVYNSNL
jgi:hypothetical protein